MRTGVTTPGYSWCGKCKTSFDQVRGHDVPVDEGTGFGSICEECWPEMTVEQRLVVFACAFERWGWGESYCWEQIEAAVRRESKITDNALTLSEFWDQLAEWSQATFGPDNVRGPEGPLKHLIKEANEALEKPTEVVEFADCLFLVFDATRRAGFTFEDLRLAVNKKLKVNRQRKWPAPKDGEPVEHVRE